MFFIPKLRRRRYADRRAWRSIEISTDYRRRLPYLPVRQHCEPDRSRIARAWSAYSFFRSSFSGIGGAQARTQALAPDQDADQRQMHQVEEDAGGEGDGIKTGVIVDRTGEPAAKCHARAAEQQQGWHAP